MRLIGVGVAIILLCNVAIGQMTEDQQREVLKAVRLIAPLVETMGKRGADAASQRQIEIIHAILKNTPEGEIHRMRGASGNEVWLSPDGHREVVFDESGKLVRDGFNDGSYNYFRGHDEPLPHFTFDSVPWMLWGHSPKDPTSKAERVKAYCADICSGAKYALAQNERQKVETEQLTARGSNHAIAIFLEAIKQGEATEIFELFDRKDNVTDEELVAVIKKFEVGLNRILEKLDVPKD